MSLSLTSDDLRHVEAGQRALLSGLSHDTVESWRADVLRRVVDLTGAHRAGFLAAPAASAGSPVSAIGIGDDTLADYVGYYADRELLRPEPTPNVQYLPDRVSRATLERAEIYADFWRPARQFDNLALTGVVENVGFAGIFLHHENERDVFGERGKALMRLLLPAFEEGLRTWGRLSGRRQELETLVDRMGEGVVLCDRTGATLHANAAAEGLLARDPRCDEVRRAIGAVAAEMAARLPGPGPKRGPAPPVPAPRRVSTVRATYRISASYLDGAAPRGAAILVTVKRAGQELPSVPRLRERFGLTRREAEVALLLARRKTNEEIAELLVVSPHTARGHTERVFQKVGVRSRRDVQQALRGD